MFPGIRGSATADSCVPMLSPWEMLPGSMEMGVRSGLNGLCRHCLLLWVPKGFALNPVKKGSFLFPPPHPSSQVNVVTKTVQIQHRVGPGNVQTAPALSKGSVFCFASENWWVFSDTGEKAPLLQGISALSLCLALLAFPSASRASLSAQTGRPPHP